MFREKRYWCLASTVIWGFSSDQTWLLWKLNIKFLVKRASSLRKGCYVSAKCSRSAAVRKIHSQKIIPIGYGRGIEVALEEFSKQDCGLHPLESKFDFVSDRKAIFEDRIHSNKQLLIDNNSLVFRHLLLRLIRSVYLLLDVVSGRKVNAKELSLPIVLANYLTILH